MGEELPRCQYSSAGGVVVDASGEQVLLLRRPTRLGPEGLPEMRLPKGHIEPGENRRQAAVREVQEEAGVSGPILLADLGHQIVEYDWKGQQFVRDESYFLMRQCPGAVPRCPEEQFEVQWLAWDEAEAQVTFEAEGEWLRRARAVSQELQRHGTAEEPNCPAA